MTVLAEWMVAGFIILGAFFSFVAGLGILRLPDTLIRMHASTKAGTLGVGMILTALMIYFNNEIVTARGIAAISFILISAPVAAHIIGRVASQTKSHNRLKSKK